MSRGKRQYGKRGLMPTLALLAAAWGLMLLIGRWISPETEQFCAAASPYVMMGLGVAGAAVFMNLKEEA